MLEFRLRFVTTDQPVLKTAYYEVNDYERRYPSELPADHDPLRLRRRVSRPAPRSRTSPSRSAPSATRSTPASRSSSTPAAAWISSTRSTASSKIGLTTFAKISPRALHAGFFVPCGPCDVTSCPPVWPRVGNIRRVLPVTAPLWPQGQKSPFLPRPWSSRRGRTAKNLRNVTKTPLPKQRGFDLCDLRKTQTIRLSRT